MQTYAAYWEYAVQEMPFYIDEGNRYIVFPPETLFIDIKEMYEKIKVWYSIYQNSKYAFPIRTIGGDPTSGGQTAGDIYFLINGYRIIYDATRVQVTGILYSDDFDTPWLQQPLVRGADLRTVYPATVSNLALSVAPSLEGLSIPTPEQNAAAVWAETVRTLTETLSTVQANQLEQVHGGVEREVWLDPALVTNGTGYQQSPFNNITDAIDYLEANGINSLVVLDDITLDRNLRNVSVRGIGQPTIDLAGFDLKGTEFHRVQLEGNYTQPIIAQECVLRQNMWLNGTFDTCSLAGDLFCVDGGIVFMKHSASGVAGTGRPTISMNAAGTTKVSIRDHGGGLTIKDSNTPTDEITVEMGGGGSVTFDSSNTAGTMVVRTTGKFVDETAGATVVNEDFVQDLYKLQGLEAGTPMTVTPTTRVAGNISQTISGDGETSSTVTRN